MKNGINLLCKIYPHWFNEDFNEDEKHRNFHHHCHHTEKYRDTVHTVQNTKRNSCEVYASNFDYHFIIKELLEEFKGKFECLGENTDKYIFFSAPIKKGNENIKIITYKIKLIDSARFMSRSLSSLADNLAEGLHKHKWKKFKSCRDSQRWSIVIQMCRLQQNLWESLLKKVCLMLRFFRHMSTWIVGKDSMKRQTRNSFMAIWQWKISQMLVINTQKESGKI